jgi:hypothetical protein
MSLMDGKRTLGKLLVKAYKGWIADEQLPARQCPRDKWRAPAEKESSS